MTTEILLVFSVLAVTIVLFVSEKLRIDVIALLIMVALPWLGLIEPLEALSGLSSNAVVSIIAVMILGHGVDRSGIRPSKNWRAAGPGKSCPSCSSS